jgi:hypothetical protein
LDTTGKAVFGVNKSKSKDSGPMLPPHPGSAQRKRTPLSAVNVSVNGRANQSTLDKLTAKPADVRFASSKTISCTNRGCTAKFDPFAPDGCKYHDAEIEFKQEVGYFWPCCQAGSSTYLTYTTAQKVKGCTEGNHAASTSVLSNVNETKKSKSQGSTLGARLQIRRSIGGNVNENVFV